MEYELIFNHCSNWKLSKYHNDEFWSHMACPCNPCHCGWTTWATLTSLLLYYRNEAGALHRMAMTLLVPFWSSIKVVIVLIAPCLSCAIVTYYGHEGEFHGLHVVQAMPKGPGTCVL